MHWSQSARSGPIPRTPQKSTPVTRETPDEGAAVAVKSAQHGRCCATIYTLIFFSFFLFFHLTYSRWTSSLPSCLWSQRIFPSLPGSRLIIFLSRRKFSTLTTRQPMVEFYLLTYSRFPLRKKEHKSYFGKNRTHDFRTSRCAAYLLDHSGDVRVFLTALPTWHRPHPPQQQQQKRFNASLYLKKYAYYVATRCPQEAQEH